jgi:hypothetical protein
VEVNGNEGRVKFVKNIKFAIPVYAPLPPFEAPKGDSESHSISKIKDETIAHVS